VVEGAGHEPPLQLALAVATPAEQLALRHWAVGYAQALTSAPSQAPPQSDPSVAQAGRGPWGAPLTATHWPTLPATLQAWHWPPQAWLQQTPSTQFPFPHWVEAVQATPSTFLGTQAPVPSQ
jgi:hypothetical protein